LVIAGTGAFPRVIYGIVKLSDGLSIQRPGSGVNTGYLTDSKKNGNAAARVASSLANLGSEWVGKVKVTRVSNPHAIEATEYVHHAVGHCWNCGPFGRIVRRTTRFVRAGSPERFDFFPLYHLSKPEAKKTTLELGFLRGLFPL
jgi:hypothetical protein